MNSVTRRGVSSEDPAVSVTSPARVYYDNVANVDIMSNLRSASDAPARTLTSESGSQWSRDRRRFEEDRVRTEKIGSVQNGLDEHVDRVVRGVSNGQVQEFSKVL